MERMWGSMTPIPRHTFYFSSHHGKYAGDECLEATCPFISRPGVPGSNDGDTLGVVLPHGGIVFGAAAGWRRQVVERFFIYHIKDGGSRRRGAMGIRCPMQGDGLAQEEDAVWRHGGVDGREA